MAAFSPKEGVDRVWPGKGVIYSQRLSARRTASRLNRITASPHYKSMTIRSWQTTLALLDLMRGRGEPTRTEMETDRYGSSGGIASQPSFGAKSNATR